MAKNYREVFLSSIPKEIIPVLNSLVQNLQDLQSGKIDQQLDEEIWRRFETARKAQALRVKPLEQMRLEREIDKKRNEKGNFVNRKRDLENQTRQGIYSLTSVLIEVIKELLTSEIAELSITEFARVKKETGDKVTVSTNTRQVESAQSLIRNALDKVSEFHYVDGETFYELLKPLAEQLSNLQIEAGETVELTKTQYETLREKIENNRPGKKLYDPKSIRPIEDVLMKAKQTETDLLNELRQYK